MNLGAARLGYRFVHCSPPTNTISPTIVTTELPEGVLFSKITSNPSYVPNGTRNATLIATGASVNVNITLPFNILFYEENGNFLTSYNNITVSSLGFIAFTNNEKAGPHIIFFDGSTRYLNVYTRNLGTRFVVYMDGNTDGAPADILNAEFSFYPNKAYFDFYSTAVPFFGNHILAAGQSDGNYYDSVQIVASTKYRDTVTGSVYGLINGVTTIVSPLLTVDNGSWNSTGIPTFSYLWNKNDTPISGATSITYLLTEEVTQNSPPAFMTVQVTARDQCGATTVYTPAVEFGYPPVSYIPPVLSFVIAQNPPHLSVGDELIISDGTWLGSTPLIITYQWYRDNTLIGTSNTYTIVAEDLTATIISVTVTASNDFGSDSKSVSLGRSTFKTSNTLVVYDLNSVHPGHYDTDVNPSQIAASIVLYEAELGFTTTIVTSYSELSTYTDEQLAEFAFIWDVGYDTLITSSVANQYKNYLSTNGAMFLLGENGSFYERDGNIDNFISSVGGGIITPSSIRGNYETCTINPTFFFQNQTATVLFDAPGRFDEYGSGIVMASNGSFGVVAVVWTTCTLMYPGATIASVLDINFLVSPLQPDFIRNLVLTLNSTQGVCGTSPPSLSVSPIISGSTTVDETLTCNPGVWFGAAPIMFSYEWRYDDGTAIGVGSDYIIQTSDLGKYIYCYVTATNPYASAYAPSQTVGPVTTGIAPVNIAIPVVSGTYDTASTQLNLITDDGTWTGTAVITYSYEWYVDGVSNSNFTEQTYIDYGNYLGKEIYVKVTASNHYGSATVQSTSFIVPNVVPSITGVTRQLSTLTLNPGTSLPGTQYIWIRKNTITDQETVIMVGGTTYTLGEIDVDCWILVDVVVPTTNGTCTYHAGTWAITSAAPGSAPYYPFGVMSNNTDYNGYDLSYAATNDFYGGAVTITQTWVLFREAPYMNDWQYPEKYVVIPGPTATQIVTNESEVFLFKLWMYSSTQIYEPALWAQKVLDLGWALYQPFYIACIVEYRNNYGTSTYLSRTARLGYHIDQGWVWPAPPEWGDPPGTVYWTIEF